jgi:hypothetical protein
MHDAAYINALAEYGSIGLGVGVLLYVLRLLVSKGYRIKIDLGPTSSKREPPV